MKPAHDLLPGNADLAPLVVPRRHAPWAEPLMMITSVMVVAAMLILSRRFEPIFKELGIQVPATPPLVHRCSRDLGRFPTYEAVEPEIEGMLAKFGNNLPNLIFCIIPRKGIATTL